MVKNTTGGTGTKSLGRKYQTSFMDKHLRLSENEFEKYACVTKLLGNGMCQIHTSDNKKLLGHIRKKFKGKNKRNNLVSLHSIVLVGLRDYENPPKNCDIMVIYDDIQIEQIKQIPSINITEILEMRNIDYGNDAKANNENDIEFSLEESMNEEKNTKIKMEDEDLKIEDLENINIDDI